MRHDIFGLKLEIFVSEASVLPTKCNIILIWFTRKVLQQRKTLENGPGSLQNEQTESK